MRLRLRLRVRPGMAKSKRVSVAQQNKPSPAGSSGKADRSTKRDSIGGGISKKGKRKERKQTFLKRLKEAQDHLALGATNADVLASVRQIGDSLPDFKTRAAAPKRSKPLSNKSRQKLFTTEVAQFASVLQHPSFNEDPLSAIRLHLENTVDTAPLAEETEAPSDEDTSGAPDCVCCPRSLWPVLTWCYSVFRSDPVEAGQEETERRQIGLYQGPWRRKAPDRQEESNQEVERPEAQRDRRTWTACERS